MNDFRDRLPLILSYLEGLGLTQTKDWTIRGESKGDPTGRCHCRGYGETLEVLVLNDLAGVFMEEGAYPGQLTLMIMRLEWDYKHKRWMPTTFCWG